MVACYWFHRECMYTFVVMHTNNKYGEEFVGVVVTDECE